MKVRQANLADENTVLKMARAFHIEDGHPLAATSAQAIRGALEGSDFGKIFLVEIDEKVQGYFVLCFTLSIEFGGLVVILDDLYLDPSVRGRGLGSAVMNEVRIMSQKARAVQIFLEVENKNTRAKKFYERLGFKIRNRGMMEFLFSPEKND